MPKLGIIILAAGGSSRMGQPKQLLKINGESLIRKTIKVAMTLDPEKIIVVLGNAFDEIYSEIKDLPVIIIENTDWQKGMSSSLRIGVMMLNETLPETGASMVLLCDQPLISTSILAQLRSTFEATVSKAVAAAYNNIKGVPAIFDFTTLLQFSQEDGDYGARHLIKRLDKEKQVLSISFPEGAVDLDTPEDFEQFNS